MSISPKFDWGIKAMSLSLWLNATTWRHSFVGLTQSASFWLQMHYSWAPSLFKSPLFPPYLTDVNTGPLLWQTPNVFHYIDVIMSAMASQITGVSTACTTVYSGADQRKHQSSATLAFVRGIHRWPVNSPHKGPVTRKMFPFDDVIMSN